MTINPPNEVKAVWYILDNIGNEKLLDNHRYCIVLSNYRFWGPRQDNLDLWLKDYNACRYGSVILYDDKEFEVIFKLKYG